MKGEPKPETVFKGQLITVKLQPVRRPNGKIARYEMVDHPDAAAIVAVLNRDGEPMVALVRQERPAIGQETWEIPAGLIGDDDHDNPEETAMRELREETGFTAGTLRFLHRHYPSPGFMNEAISIYLATDLREAPGAPPPDPDEISDLRWTPLSEAMEMCRKGEISDGKTVIGLWLARDVLAQGVPAPKGTRRPRRRSTQAQAPAAL